MYSSAFPLPKKRRPAINLSLFWRWLLCDAGVSFRPVVRLATTERELPGDMNTVSNGNAVKELHRALARKYKKHAATIESTWRSLDRNQRARCLLAGAAGGAILKHASDQSRGEAYKIVPEWNLRDITEPGPEFLVDMLRHRATKPLFEQYCAGTNGAPGDRAFIQEMIRTKGLSHAQRFKHCYTFFLDDGKYGTSYRIMSDLAGAMAAFTPAIRAGLALPQSTGELILQRKATLLQSLDILIEDILEKSDNAATTTRSWRSSMGA